MNVDVVALSSSVHELKKLKAMRVELEKLIDAEEATVKGLLGDIEDAVILDEGTVRYASVTTTRVDSKALKKELPDVAARYTTTTTTRRLTVA